tara:strand:+ start:371 stop:826 length:456 start_codon:yes stop_codon:yes gene_type:complete
MFILNVALSIVLTGTLLFLLFLVQKNLALSKLHAHVGEELHSIIDNVDRAGQKIAAAATGNLIGPGEIDSPGDALLEDAGLLATMLTAIVTKYGDMRIKMSDIDSLGENAFISVYIDTTAQELILSMEPNLVENKQLVFEKFLKSDDGTFH